MEFVELTKVAVGKRQRKQIDPTALLELKMSILDKGLFHPPMVWRQGEGFELILGERRFRAVEEIAKAGRNFRHGEHDIPPGQIPVTIVDFLNDIGRFGAELEENTHRVDLTWQEKAEALAALHSMRKAANPTQTLADTAAEIVEAGRGVGTAPDRDLGGSKDNRVKNQAAVIKQAAVVAKYLNDPAIAKARNMTEAYNQILRKEETRINAEIVRRSHTLSPSSSSIEIREADLLVELPSLPAEFVDLIFADPPYGVGANSGGFRQRTEVHHNYEDTPEIARRIALAILTEGFRVAKPRANLLMFTDIALWDFLQSRSASMGWMPFRRPIIWGKSESEGLAPWGANGPRITTELIFFATKGKKGMYSSPTDYIADKRVPRTERDHGAQKPVNLLKLLIECTTLPGDFVLDPCCGSGSTLVAARDTKRSGLGLELDRDYVNVALSRLAPTVPADANLA